AKSGEGLPGLDFCSTFYQEKVEKSIFCIEDFIFQRSSETFFRNICSPTQAPDAISITIPCFST
ncbi:MAG: hypothetical protein LWX09_04450, partial [Bacteroidia bacterium]|nr:hypothetical protein [Bacteroidia bacterium]